MVSNGCYDWNFDGEPSMFEMLYMHNIISASNFKQWRDNDCFNSYFDVIPKILKPECLEAWDQMEEQIEGLNYWDIY